MKNKKYLLLIILFLVAQIGALQHAATHGFEKHKHHGQACDVYLYGEKTKHTGAAPYVEELRLEYGVLARSQILPVFLLIAVIDKATAPRAPPLFS